MVFWSGEGKAPEVTRPCIDCDLKEEFLKASFLQGNRHVQGFKGLKVLLFGSETDTNKFLQNFCAPCALYPRQYDDDMVTKEYRCGETRVLISNKMDHLDKNQDEELDIRVSGRTSWGKPMRASGVFSRFLLGRSYGRDDIKFEHKPNAVVVLTKGEVTTPANASVQKLCKKENVSFYSVPATQSYEALASVAQNTRSILQNHFVTLWGKDRYNAGFADGRRDVDAAFIRGREAARAEFQSREESKIAKAFKDGYLQGRRDESEGRPNKYEKVKKPQPQQQPQQQQSQQTKQ